MYSLEMASKPVLSPMFLRRSWMPALIANSLHSAFGLDANLDKIEVISLFQLIGPLQPSLEQFLNHPGDFGFAPDRFDLGLFDRLLGDQYLQKAPCPRVRGGRS